MSWPHITLDISLDRPAPPPLWSPPAIPVGAPIPVRILLSLGGAAYTLPADAAISLAGLPARSGAPVLFRSGGFSPHSTAAGTYEALLPTRTAAAISHINLPPIGPKRIDLDLTITAPTQQYSLRLPADLLPLAEDGGGGGSTPITGAAVLSVPAPTAPDDFSMFPAELAPSTGTYEAADGMYVYRFSAGWTQWLRSPIANWTN